MGFDISGLMGVADQAYNIFLIILALVLAGGIVFYLAFLRQFKHKFRIKQVISGRKIVFDDKFRELTDSDGGKWYDLLKLKKKFPVAPSEAIELDVKGRKVVEGYMLETGEIIYAKDVSEPFPKEIMDIKDAAVRKEKLKEWCEDHQAIVAYQPLTTQQRAILIGQIQKAHLKKTTKWQDYIIPIAGLSALVIIVVALLGFWGEIAKPVIEANKERTVQITIQKETMQILQEIKQDIQVMKSEKGRGEPPN